MYLVVVRKRIELFAHFAQVTQLARCEVVREQIQQDIAGSKPREELCCMNTCCLKPRSARVRHGAISVGGCACVLKL